MSPPGKSYNSDDDDNRSLTVAAREVAAEDFPIVFDRHWRDACRTMSQADIEPRTYFCTFTCYGTWLHGDARGSVDRAHNEWQTPPLAPDEERERREFERLKHSPVKFEHRQRDIVRAAIEEVCRCRGWRLHALNVRTNHVHVVVTANRKGKRVLNDLKSYGTRRLKEARCLPAACYEALRQSPGLECRRDTGGARGLKPLPDGRGSTGNARGRRFRSRAKGRPSGGRDSAVEPEFKVWTRGGSARHIDSDESFKRAIDYTLYEQGPEIKS